MNLSQFVKPWFYFEGGQYSRKSFNRITMAGNVIGIAEHIIALDEWRWEVFNPFVTGYAGSSKQACFEADRWLQHRGYRLMKDNHWGMI